MAVDYGGALLHAAQRLIVDVQMWPETALSMIMVAACLCLVTTFGWIRSRKLRRDLICHLKDMSAELDQVRDRLEREVKWRTASERVAARTPPTG